MSGPPADYIDVAERLVEFRETYPDGSLQQVGLQFLDFAGKSWVVYTAAAYRNPDDPRPGHGTAWEPVPGPTNFTRDSELQNAETSAWGRAMVAALAADTKRGVASANEVRNRQPDPAPQVDLSELERVIGEAKALSIEGDYGTTREWAAGSQQNADAAAAKLRKAIAAKQAEDETASSEADRSGGDDGSEQASTSSPPDTTWRAMTSDQTLPTWRDVMEAAGVKGEDLLVRLIQKWPHDDQSAKPLRTNDLDRAAERHRDLVGQCIGELEDEKRGANA